MATLLLSVMGAFAEFERALIRGKATSYSQGQRLSVVMSMKFSASAAKHARSA
jgi:DNA invertase Pin-like site-specific DNA recombinase